MALPVDCDCSGFCLNFVDERALTRDSIQMGDVIQKRDKPRVVAMPPDKYAAALAEQVKKQQERARQEKLQLDAALSAEADRVQRECVFLLSLFVVCLIAFFPCRAFSLLILWSILVKISFHNLFCQDATRGGQGIREKADENARVRSLARPAARSEIFH